MTRFAAPGSAGSRLSKGPRGFLTIVRLAANCP